MSSKNAANLKARKQYGKSVLRRLKTMKGCKACGYKGHHAALEFNHRKPQDKKHTISSLAVSVSLTRNTASKIVLKEELSKCDILCANCHRVVTFENQHQWNPKYKLDTHHDIA